MIPEHFPNIFGPSEDQPLDVAQVKLKFTDLAEKVSLDTGKILSAEGVADGFIQVANEAMCRPIRGLTEARGHEISAHELNVFGGAGGQHACEIAENLGIGRVVLHKHSSILSAYGMALAEVVEEAQEPTMDVLDGDSLCRINERFLVLKANVVSSLLLQGVSERAIDFELYLNLRYQGTDTAMMVLNKKGEDFRTTFLAQHLHEFGFVWQDDRKIFVDDIRVRGVGKTDSVVDDATSLTTALSVTRFEPVLKKAYLRRVSIHKDEVHR